MARLLSPSMAQETPTKPAYTPTTVIHLTLGRKRKSRRTKARSKKHYHFLLLHLYLLLYPAPARKMILLVFGDVYQSIQGIFEAWMPRLSEPWRPLKRPLYALGTPHQTRINNDILRVTT